MTLLLLLQLLFWVHVTVSVSLCPPFLSIDANQLSFPNEQDAAALFSDYSGLSLFSATQQDLQAALDKCLFDDLFV